MRRRVFSGLAVVCAACAVPMSAMAKGPVIDPLRGATTHISLGPRAIGTHTNVLVRFRQPLTTGSNADERTVEALEVSGPARPECIGSARVVLASARAGTMVSRRLRPNRLGGRWCTGTYDGRLTYQEQPVCTDPGPVRAKVVACPMFIMAPRTLATFHFRVTAR